MRRLTGSLMCGIAIILSMSQASALVIAQNTAGPFLNSEDTFVGQSFVTTAGGPFNNITFNFFSDIAPAVTPTAIGTGFLLSQTYTGTPDNLSAATPGFLGESTVISGGQYIFPTVLTLQSATTYFFYQNGTIIPTGGISGSNTVAGINDFFSPSATTDFAPDTASANFQVNGAAVTAPEPGAAAMMGVGTMLVLGAGWFRRRRL